MTVTMDYMQHHSLWIPHIVRQFESLEGMVGSSTYNENNYIEEITACEYIKWLMTTSNSIQKIVKKKKKK